MGFRGLRWEEGLKLSKTHPVTMIAPPFSPVPAALMDSKNLPECVGCIAES
jgi:hypothetical protein